LPTKSNRGRFGVSQQVFAKRFGVSAILGLSHPAQG